jgi:hypothetical protein
LAGPPWQKDHDVVALAALAASLSPIKLVDLAANNNNEQGEDDHTDVEANFTFKARETIVDLFQRLWGLNVSPVKQRHTFESGCRFLWEGAFRRTTPRCGRHCPRVAGVGRSGLISIPLPGRPTTRQCASDNARKIRHENYCRRSSIAQRHSYYSSAQAGKTRDTEPPFVSFLCTRTQST